MSKCRPYPKGRIFGLKFSRSPYFDTHFSESTIEFYTSDILGVRLEVKI